MIEKMDDLLLLQTIVARLQGKSWNTIAAGMVGENGQTLRRHTKAALFPTRKKR